MTGKVREFCYRKPVGTLFIIFYLYSVRHSCIVHTTLLCVGLLCFLPAVQCMSSSPTKLVLSHTGITSRGANRLMDVIRLKCETTSDVSQLLDLSDNCLKGEDVAVSVSE